VKWRTPVYLAIFVVFWSQPRRARTDFDAQYIKRRISAVRKKHCLQLITEIPLHTLYVASTAGGGAAALLSNYAPAVSDTTQEPWRSLNSLSTDFLVIKRAYELYSGQQRCTGPFALFWQPVLVHLVFLFCILFFCILDNKDVRLFPI